MSDHDSSSDWSDDTPVIIGLGHGLVDYRYVSDDDHYDPAPVNRPLLSCPQHDPELVKTYYTAYKGLLDGSSSRQALPLELVLYICRLANFECWYTKRAPEGQKNVHAWGPEVQSLVWFETVPFTKQMLGHIKSVQLVAISRHQGWVSDREAGSWSWFELRVARPTKRNISRVKHKYQPDGDVIYWRCLEHPVDEETAQLQGEFAEHKGDVFDSDHEIWSQIEEGDVLQVVMKARFGGWSNTAQDGMLRVGTWWEPSPEMLNLMRKNNDNPRSV